MYHVSLLTKVRPPRLRVLNANRPQLESVEGLSEGWIIYRMKGTIERGFMQKDEITRKSVRVVRTLDPADLGSTLEMVCI